MGGGGGIAGWFTGTCPNDIGWEAFALIPKTWLSLGGGSIPYYLLLLTIDSFKGIGGGGILRASLSEGGGGRSLGRLLGSIPDTLLR